MNETLKDVIIASIGVMFLISIPLAGYPLYKVWQKGLAGQAMLKEAEFSKQIQVEQAKADLDSSKLWAEAEVIRAKGVAESTRIISGELQKNENYLQYLAIQAQMKMAESQNHTTVYIPSGYNGIPLIKEISK